MKSSPLLMFSLSLVCILLCAESNQAQQDPASFVRPLAGTQRMGHTYPGATVPFGMVQLSPDTDTIPYEKNGKYNGEVYNYCSGYQYDDNTIVGFSHTHFSGTGHSDLGDFLIMPTVGALKLSPGTKNIKGSGYRSSYSHSNEIAEPAYYKVRLDDYDVIAELTASTRVGFHQYTFPATDQAHIILDMMHGIYNFNEKNVWTFIRVENDTLLTGYRQTTGWARTRTVYFAMTINKPIQSYGCRNFDESVYKGFWKKFDQNDNFPEIAGRQIRMYFNFATTAGEKVKIKFALSPVSTGNALMNLLAEIPGWDFEKIKEQGRAAWNRELGKIKAEFITEKDKLTFYTSLYHCFLGPTVYMDVDGSYRGLDMSVHQAKDFVNYTTFSLWDTYRALHPLFNVLQPARNRDMIKSMLAHYDQSVHSMLPVWSHYANENWCMTGYHSVSVIADAAIKGNDDFDLDKALKACISTSNYDKFDGIAFYKKYGFVPDDKNSSSVSKTLEYAYDDWTISQLAGKLNNELLQKKYYIRSFNFLNVFDKSIGFMRPKLSDSTFRSPFNPLSTHNQGFIEGNSWNYTFHAPHQVPALIGLMGGEKKFIQRLDSLFEMELPDEFFKETEDITRDGLVGTYVHGNEPSHHVPYLYNYAGKPEKTQEKVRMLLDKMYSYTPDGLCGNDDCGQMSAWYIFSALGFYPVCPGSDRYDIGSPSVISATLSLENGNEFIIRTQNQRPENVHVKKMILNGIPLNKTWLQHSQIMSGGILEFEMEK
ncbi:MAG: GH92 family glycosyl hydrolase [Bacteroidales bacterium]